MPIYALSILAQAAATAPLQGSVPPWWILLTIAIIGIAVGLLGGMLGIGGSVVMIPAMVWLFSEHPTPGWDTQLFIAAGLIVSLIVAIPSAFGHWRNGNIIPTAIHRMLPAAIVAIILGAIIGGLPVFQGNGSRYLRYALGVFLGYIVISNIIKLLSKTKPHDEEPNEAILTWPRCLLAGSTMGTLAGLLGIGGGSIVVPLQQQVMRVPLKNAIAVSCVVMCLTSIVGAISKNIAFAYNGGNVLYSLMLAGIFAPSAMIAALFGAKLTNILPRRVVLTVFTIIIALGCYKMFTA